MLLAQDDDVVEALTTELAQESFDVTILPERARRDQDFLDAKSVE